MIDWATPDVPPPLPVSSQKLHPHAFYAYRNAVRVHVVYPPGAGVLLLVPPGAHRCHITESQNVVASVQGLDAHDRRSVRWGFIHHLTGRGLCLILKAYPKSFVIRAKGFLRRTDGIFKRNA